MADLKAAIAFGVQRELLERGVPLGGMEVPEMECGHCTLEASSVTPLETRIRARTLRGVRYFTVKVTENI